MEVEEVSSWGSAVEEGEGEVCKVVLKILCSKGLKDISVPAGTRGESGCEDTLWSALWLAMR